MTTTVPAADIHADLNELAVELRRVEQDCTARLEHALNAMAGGDFTARIEVDPTYIDVGGEWPELRQLTDVINSIQTRTLAAVDAYETLRRDLNRALGDQSCLSELIVALQSLNAHCLTDLDSGLQAMADGDFTLEARPVTHPLRTTPGNNLGVVGDTFNLMLARSRTALRSYDALREDLRERLGDRSCLDELQNGLRSLQRHCLRDLEEALEALVEGTSLTRAIAPATEPIVTPPGQFQGEMASLFNRALSRAQAAVRSLGAARDLNLRP